MRIRVPGLPEIGLLVLLGGSAQSQAVVTAWNAYNDFYFSPSASGWGGATTPSAAGAAWGYYMGNVNGVGFPTSIGTYLNSGQIYKYANHDPLGAQDTRVLSTQFWDATGGAGFARYVDTLGWGTSLGRFDTSNTWWDGAPGYSQGISNLIWMQANSIGNPGAEGIAAVLAWRAPSTGTYTLSGQYVTANQPANGASFAIVDSQGSLLSRTVLANNTATSFSYTKTYNAGDVVQFQAGSDSKTGNAIGLQVNIIPEPSSGALLAAGLSALGLIRLRRRA